MYQAGEPRTEKMPVDQDWTAVYPAATPFRPGSVPLPVRMGYPMKGSIPPEKKGNLELIKVRPRRFSGTTTYDIKKKNKKTFFNTETCWMFWVLNKENSLPPHLLSNEFSCRATCLSCRLYLYLSLYILAMTLWVFTMSRWVNWCSPVPFDTDGAHFTLLHGSVSVPGLLSCCVQTPAAPSGLEPLADPLLLPVTAGALPCTLTILVSFSQCAITG